MVPDRADTWTRMVYAGPNKPIAPIDDPVPDVRQALRPDRRTSESLKSVLDDLQDDLKKVGVDGQRRGPPAARRARHVRPRDGAGAARRRRPGRRPRGPRARAGRARRRTTTSRKISKMQIDLMVNSFAADFARVATLQYTNSVGGARMHWLGVDEGHHELSHKPDSDEEAAGEADEDQQVVLRAAGLPGEAAGRDARAGRRRQPARQHADRLDQRAGQGQLAHARQHPLRAGRQRPRLPDGPVAQVQPKLPHNRLLLSLAHGMGHRIETFGNPNFCGERAAAEPDLTPARPSTVDGVAARPQCPRRRVSRADVGDVTRLFTGSLPLDSSTGSDGRSHADRSCATRTGMQGFGCGIDFSCKRGPTGV